MTTEEKFELTIEEIEALTPEEVEELRGGMTTTTCCPAECIPQVTATQTVIRNLCCCYTLEGRQFFYPVLDLSDPYFKTNKVLISYKVCEGDAVLWYRPKDSIFYRILPYPCQITDLENVEKILIKRVSLEEAKVIVRYTLFTDVEVKCGCCTGC